VSLRGGGWWGRGAARAGRARAAGSARGRHDVRAGGAQRHEARRAIDGEERRGRPLRVVFHRVRHRVAVLVEDVRRERGDDVPARRVQRQAEVGGVGAGGVERGRVVDVVERQRDGRPRRERAAAVEAGVGRDERELALGAELRVFEVERAGDLERRVPRADCAHGEPRAFALERVR